MTTIQASQVQKLSSNFPVYMVYGGEPLQTLETSNFIKAKLFRKGYNERKLFEVDTFFNWSHLLRARHQLDLFSDKQLIEIHLHKNKIGTKGLNVLVHFILNQPSDVCLLILAENLPYISQKSKLFMLIQNIGCLIIAKPFQSDHVFLLWLKQRFKSAGFTLSQELLYYLSQFCSGNLPAVAQLIEKLILTHAMSHLDVKDIRGYLNNDAQFSVFYFIEMMMKQNLMGTCQILESLKDRVEPILVLWAIIREFRLLIKIKYELNSGKSFDKICKNYRIWSNRALQIRKFLDKTTVFYLESLLHKSLAVDIISKRLQPGLVWESLTTICLKFAGIKTHFSTIEEITI